MWENCLKRLETVLPKDQVTLWIRPLDVELVNDSITLEASNDIILNKIRTHFLTYIKAVLKELTGKEVAVELKLKQINHQPQTTPFVKKKIHNHQNYGSFRSPFHFC
jgi:chromosomal replication initiator protein